MNFDFRDRRAASAWIVWVAGIPMATTIVIFAVLDQPRRYPILACGNALAVRTIPLQVHPTSGPADRLLQMQLDKSVMALTGPFLLNGLIFGKSRLSLPDFPSSLIPDDGLDRHA
ncbi:hypothetical protein [Nonomuraea jabiensis]|uniref:hypothetical protein n=1 Tax=Nonomuraea jabiensis TaxID=882448 RepID=UPI003D70F721